MTTRTTPTPPPTRPAGWPLLLVVGLAFCPILAHGCHGEDHDDELHWREPAAATEAP